MRERLLPGGGGLEERGSGQGKLTMECQMCGEQGRYGGKVPRSEEVW